MEAYRIGMNIEILDSLYAVCKISAANAIPDWAAGDFVSLTVTDQEYSLVTPQHSVPEGVECQRDWRAFRISGTLDFSLIGIISRITGILADAAVPVFVLSTFDTDYFLVPNELAEIAQQQLREFGYTFCR